MAATAFAAAPPLAPKGLAPRAPSASARPHPAARAASGASGRGLAAAIAGAAAAGAASDRRRRRGVAPDGSPDFPASARAADYVEDAPDVPASARAAGADAAEDVAPGRLFEPWAAWFQAHFADAFALREEELPEGLSRRREPGEKGRATISSRVWTSEAADGPIRRLRITLVDNGKQLQAFNAVVYPSHALGPLPVLGADVLSFGNHARLLFGVDWAPLELSSEYAEENIGAHLADVVERNAELYTAPSGKFYGERPEFFSPHMFLSKPSGAAALRPDAELWGVFVEYCERYSARLRLAGKQPEASCERAEVRQAAYDKWHAERDPAMPIFRKLFGEDWTEEFIGRVLFPGSREL